MGLGNKRVKELEEINKDLRKKNVELVIEVKKLQGIVDNMQAEVKDVHSELAEVTLENKQIHSQLQDLNKKKDRAESKASRLSLENATIQKQLDTARDTILRLQQEIYDKQLEIEGLQLSSREIKEEQVARGTGEIEVTDNSTFDDMDFIDTDVDI